MTRFVDPRSVVEMDALNLDALRRLLESKLPAALSILEQMVSINSFTENRGSTKRVKETLGLGSSAHFRF